MLTNQVAPYLFIIIISSSMLCAKFHASIQKCTIIQLSRYTIISSLISVEHLCVYLISLHLIFVVCFTPCSLHSRTFLHVPIHSLDHSLNL